MYTLPQKIEAAGINAFFTSKIVFNILYREKTWKEGLYTDFTVLISFYMESARYWIPQENGPYLTQIILATLYLSKMSTTQTAISLSMLSIVKILLFQLFILQKNSASLCVNGESFQWSKLEHFNPFLNF